MRRVEQYFANVSAAEAICLGQAVQSETRGTGRCAGAPAFRRPARYRRRKFQPPTMPWMRQNPSFPSPSSSWRRSAPSPTATTSRTIPRCWRQKRPWTRALLDLERTEIRAPVDGVVASRRAQIGQRVKVGSSLMNVVPLMDAHVDANFKEVQLQHIRPGQKVDLTSDLYGGKCRFPWPGRGAGRRHGLGLRGHSRPECHRQLDQGGSAPAGPHCAGPRRNWPAIRCASASP